MINKSISKNFNINEFLESQTATRKGYKEQFTPSDEVIDNIIVLVTKLIQPLRDILTDDGTLNGSIIVSSGYRCPRLNRAIGGKPTSQHQTGMAADLVYYENGVKLNKKLFDILLRSKLLYDQCIMEHGTLNDPAWIHLSYNVNEKANRRQHFRIE